MTGYDFLKLMPNKVNQRPYGYFLKFSCFDFLWKWFFNHVKKIVEFSWKNTRTFRNLDVWMFVDKIFFWKGARVPKCNYTIKNDL
jgi:hypothetical protein